MIKKVAEEKIRVFFIFTIFLEVENRDFHDFHRFSLIFIDFRGFPWISLDFLKIPVFNFHKNNENEKIRIF